MEEDGIGLVLAKAIELKSKISNCIKKSSLNNKILKKEETLNGESVISQIEEEEEGEASDGEEEEEEAESLLNIKDALESLEAQLTSLQNLQQQQRYEREAALGEIDYSRKMLLHKLKEYKGEDLEVIREASAFASESVEYNNDLLLPPYPSHPPHRMALGNGFFPHFSSVDKSVRNGFLTSNLTNEARKATENNPTQVRSRNSRNGLGFLISSAAKIVLTVVGVVSILSLAGYEPRLRRKDTHFKYLGLFQMPNKEAIRSMVQCPPGKVMVVENGETRCLVKERVEIPFENVVATPDVNYGCG